MRRYASALGAFWTREASPGDGKGYDSATRNLSGLPYGHTRLGPGDGQSTPEFFTGSVYNHYQDLLPPGIKP